MNVATRLAALGVADKLIELAQTLVETMSPNIDFFCDTWEILSWMARPGNRTSVALNFGQFENDELRTIAKIYIAAKRIKGDIGSGGAHTIFSSLLKLDAVIGRKTANQLTNSDFDAVERIYRNKGVVGKVAILSNLQAFSRWLHKRTGVRLSYSAPKGRADYGRHGSEMGREKKLLPIEVLHQLFKLANNPELKFRDRFFIHALVLNAALGCRINELACLPLDCLESRDGKWVVKLFPEKGGRLFYRPFPQDMYPSVKAAVDFITEHTSEGREIVRRLRVNPGVDWPRVRNSAIALEYYVRKFAAGWLENYSLYTPKGAWYRTTGQFVDAIQLFDRFGSIYKASAFLGATYGTFKKLLEFQKALHNQVFLYLQSKNSWVPLTSAVSNWKAKLRLHPHAVQISLMEELCEVELSDACDTRVAVGKILDEALECQLEGGHFLFVYNPELEREYTRKILPTVRDGSDVLLEPEDSLFVVPRNLLSEHQCTRTSEFTMVSESMFEGWLAKASRSERSVFNEFNVLDPRTGRVANFVWHDVRHWLNTIYKQGGLSDVQVNIILGRTDLNQAQVYDHTSALSRSRILQQMMQRVRDNKAVGLIQATFNKLKIEDRKSAEAYLNAALRVINPMPHGGCAHNLALKPCEYNLSCFAKGSNGKPCEALIVDSQDPVQRREIELVSQNARAIKVHILNAGGGASHQYQHFDTVEKSANYLLEEIWEKHS